MFKRSLFDRELTEIRTGIAALGQQATQAALLATHALVANDFEEARQVKLNDRETDALRYHIENICLTTIATQQPVARDLRELLAATFVAVELERCGDYAKGVAKAARKINRANADSTFAIEPFVALSDAARSLLERSIAAYMAHDEAAARQVIDDDAKLDELYQTLIQTASSAMSQKPSLIESGIWLMHAGHCLERIGDRATNLAERVIFIETGALSQDLRVEDAHKLRITS
ncbi:MAG TPA: phosphate signaling complex protein PhoU [Thermoflexales bacterium]|nr:phosphate signaling complex protein PhoU [Thermoflexales bacterium]HQW34052.1 phosphate signaling complex protein PhoU [Thermoflexales bacterium]HRA00086.1 phosphate signaling complex protein PhoU [Thermoflexales bacterium]